MNARQLKVILDSLPEEDLDIEVRVFADHGQQAMPAASAGEDYIEENTYMGELVHPDDATEDSVKVLLISD